MVSINTAQIGMLPLSALAFLAGCASLPDLGKRPEPLEPNTIAASRALSAEPAAAWPADNWWMEFSDPQLNALIDEGLRGSPDVAAAMARLRRAQALAQVAGAKGLPQVDVQGSATVSKQSYNYGFPKEFLPQGWQDYADLAGVLRFDLDIWGKNRAALAAATSEARAAAVDAAQARILLASGIATAYADLERLYALRDVRQAAIDMRAASQKLVTQRSEAGLDTQGSVRLSLAQSAAARADLAEVDGQIALLRNQIAALVGAGPDRGLDIARPRLSSPSGLGLPEGVTTDLVGRRADVVVARERVEAQASRIKVARADFYPALRLEALVGMQSLGLGIIDNAGSSYGRVGPAFSLPIFHGGELRGRYRAERASFDEAVANYDRTVLGAYREVADAVAQRRQVSLRLAEARAALEASEGAYGIAKLRYNAGLSTYLDVLAVEDRLLQARRTASDIEAIARDADIALIRALGGGYRQPERTQQSEAQP